MEEKKDEEGGKEEEEEGNKGVAEGRVAALIEGGKQEEAGAVSKGDGPDRIGALP